MHRHYPKAIEPFFPLNPRLTGSRLFGMWNVYSDWDFYIEDSDLLPLNGEWTEVKHSSYIKESFVISRILVYRDYVHLICLKPGTISMMDDVHYLFYHTASLNGKNRGERKELFYEYLTYASLYPTSNNIGYRCFILGKTWSREPVNLLSTHFQFRWELAEWNKARCGCHIENREIRHSSEHFRLFTEGIESPLPSCGFHYFNSIIWAVYYKSLLYREAIIGQIEVRGLTQNHAHGGRASEARIVKLIDLEAVK